MAGQNVTIAGASYSDVPGITLNKTGGGTAYFTDVSDTTAAAADVASGKYFYDASGVKTQGTGSGGGGAVEEKQVNFIDYDGTILHSYTKQEANALTELPSNPSHSGLTSQGWNWTLQQIKSQLTAVPDGPVWVGQSYVTASGKTEIDITLDSDRLSPYLFISPNGTVVINWGDGSSTSTVTGTSNTTPKYTNHTYSAAGDYTITLEVTSGDFAFYTSSTSYRGVMSNKSSTTDSNKYCNCVTAIRMGSNAKVGNCAFLMCLYLKYVTFPTTCTAFGDYAFASCYGLESATIPSGITTLPQYLFSSCYTVKKISIPYSVTTISKYVYENNYMLKSVTIPSGVTSIGDYGLKACSSLGSLYLPSGITTLSQYWLYNCFNIVKLTIPSSVSSVGAYAFRYNRTLEEYHFLSTSPPTIQSTTFSDTCSTRKIYVPTSAVATYKAANNWSGQKNYIYGE